jgi:hypothetical protein
MRHSGWRYLPMTVLADHSSKPSGTRPWVPAVLGIAAISAAGLQRSKETLEAMDRELVSDSLFFVTRRRPVPAESELQAVTRSRLG